MHAAIRFLGPRTTRALFVCFTLAGCATGSAPGAEQQATAEIEQAKATDRPNAAIEARYILGLTQFERGAYRLAAETFAATLLELPPVESADGLRHLLVQHIGWSLLGAYDVSGDVLALDEGEGVLERYLVKHEQLRPGAAGQREEIYELLGEYSLRREGEPPPNAHTRLQTLVLTTQRGIAREVEVEVERRASSNKDEKVRTIVVDTRRWARLDDPAVQRFFRDPRDTGATVFEGPARTYHSTRVLVRAAIAAKVDKHERRHAHALIARVRPQLERCYERAIARGADTLERVAVSLRWRADGSLSAAVGGAHGFDARSVGCVVKTLTQARKRKSGGQGAGTVEPALELKLTFFVQPPRYAPRKIGPLGGDGGRAPGAARDDIAAPIPPV